MSCFVTRPLIPVPLICWMSTLCSRAIRRTSGDDFWRRRSSSADRLVRRLGSSSSSATGRRALLAGGGVVSASGWPTAASGSSPARQPPAARPAFARRADDRHDGVDRDGLPFLDPDFGQDAGAGRRDFRVDLVGRDLEQRLVAVDRCRRPS